MELVKVKISSDAYASLIQLAQCTESEEVIALLLGETTEENKKETAHIFAIKIPQRLDKKKDRVEISVDQLIAAGEYAEELSNKTKKDIRVLGWFHSHPHITVWPSHVDLRTQGNYQLMSSSFVGIICSVFSEDKKTKKHTVELTCFQTENARSERGMMCQVRKPIPFYVVDNPDPSLGISCFKEVVRLPEILLQEEVTSYQENTDSETDPLAMMHNDMLMAKTSMHIHNKVSVPLLKYLETRERMLKLRLEVMNTFGDSLMNKFGGCSEETPSTSQNIDSVVDTGNTTDKETKVDTDTETAEGGHVVSADKESVIETVKEEDKKSTPKEEVPEGVTEKETNIASTLPQEIKKNEENLTVQTETEDGKKTADRKDVSQMEVEDIKTDKLTVCQTIEAQEVQDKRITSKNKSIETVDENKQESNEENETRMEVDEVTTKTPASDMSSVHIEKKAKRNGEDNDNILHMEVEDIAPVTDATNTEAVQPSDKLIEPQKDVHQSIAKIVENPNTSPQTTHGEEEKNKTP